MKNCGSNQPDLARRRDPHHERGRLGPVDRPRLVAGALHEHAPAQQDRARQRGGRAREAPGRRLRRAVGAQQPRARRGGPRLALHRRVQRRHGARAQLAVLVEQQPVAPAGALQQERVVLGLAVPVLVGDDPRARGMGARDARASRRGRRCRRGATSVSKGSVSRSACDRVQAAAQQLALLRVHHAERDLDRHAQPIVPANARRRRRSFGVHAALRPRALRRPGPGRGRRPADHEPLRVRRRPAAGRLRRAGALLPRRRRPRPPGLAPAGRGQARPARPRHAGLPVRRALGGRRPLPVADRAAAGRAAAAPRAAARAHRPRRPGPRAAGRAPRPRPGARRPAAALRPRGRRRRALRARARAPPARRAGRAGARCTSSRTAPSRTSSSCPRSARFRQSWRRWRDRWRSSSASCVRTRGSTCCSRPGAASPARSCGWSGCRGWTSRALRATAPPGVRFVERFVADEEIPALFRRADLVVLPYREIDQSGVLFTALAFGRPAAPQRRRRLPRDRSGKEPRSSSLSPATRRRCTPPSRACWPTRPRASAWPKARGGPPTSASAGTPSPAATSTCIAGCWTGEGPRHGAVGLARPARVRAGRLSAAAGGAAARARSGPTPGALRRRAPGEPPRRGAPGGGGHRRQGRQRARAGLAGRPARGHRRLRRVARRHARPCPGRRRRRRPRTAVGRQGPRPGRRRRRRARRAAGLLRRQRPLGPGGAARAGRRLRRPGRRLRLRPGHVRGGRRHEPGGPVLALRDGDPRARVGAVLGHRRQRRDLRGAARGLPARGPRHGARPVAALRPGEARLAGGVRPGGPGDREDGPDDRGRVRPQAADDEPRLADRPAGRAAGPARLPAALRADGPVAPRAALCVAVPAHRGTAGRGPGPWTS